MMKYIERLLHIILFSILLFSVSVTLNAQEDDYKDTLRIEETSQIDTITKKEKLRNPAVAVIFSALVPGLGQAYNKKYWKIPLIYGGGIALYTYFEFYNYQLYRFNTAYEEAYYGKEISDAEIASKFSDYTDADKTSALKVYRNKYYKEAARGLIFLGLLYIANVIDAMVDAYLFSYDISDDLSLNLEPEIIPVNNMSYASSTCGVKLCLRF